MISHSSLRFIAARAANFLAVFFGACALSAAVATLALPRALDTPENFASGFWLQLQRVTALDFGLSTIFGGPAFTVLAPLLASSFDVLAVSLPLALALGVPLGFFLAERRSQFVAGPVMQLLGSIPLFFGAILIGVAFLPPSGASFPAPVLFTGTGEEAIRSLRDMFPLVLVVGLAGAGAIAASVRHGFSIALAEPYRRAFSLLGLRDSEILVSFSFRQALGIAVRDTGIILTAMLAALAIGEEVFSWPGAGAFFLRAVALEDWAVVAALIFIMVGLRAVADLAGMLISRLMLPGDVK